MNVPSHQRELDLFVLFGVVLRQLGIVIAIPVALASLVAFVILAGPRRYTATVVFTPSSQAGAGSQLAGLAAQFGIGAASGEANDSPDFYADLVRSDAILQAAVGRLYQISTDEEGRTVQADLIRVFKVDSSTPAMMREDAGDELRSRLHVNVAPKTGTVSLSVWTEDPWLSVQIVQRIMDEVDTFNRHVRQSQAREERRFLQVRMDSAQTNLRSVQDRMQTFLQRNRDFASSPSLQFQHERIQQELTVQQAVFTSIAQAYEQARMDEVRGTPVITVVQTAVQPARPDRRRLLARAVLSLILGTFLGLGCAVAVDMVQRRGSERSAETEELRALWRRRRDQLRGWLRRGRAEK